MTRPPPAFGTAEWEAWLNEQAEVTAAAIRDLQGRHTHAQWVLIRWPDHPDREEIHAAVLDLDESIRRLVLAATQSGVRSIAEAALRCTTHTIH